VSEIGPNWGLLYPDYAFGQSTLAAFGDGLRQAGGNLSAPIAVPLTETNLTPYVSKVPADGSIVGVYDSLTGAQQVTSVTGMQQFGISQHLKLVVTGGKEAFGGIYPDVLTGAIFNSFSPEARDQFMLDYERVFRAMAQVDADVANIIGGADRAKPGSQMGYSAYAAMSALKQSMRAVHYAGAADRPKLIDTLANFKATQSSDFPGGDVLMDPNDHQGRMTQYISQVDGQNERVLVTIPAAQVPPIGTCKVGG
jgi:branched-chain amino acid transport system substrate-binding protein